MIINKEWFSLNSSRLGNCFEPALDLSAASSHRLQSPPIATQACSLQHYISTINNAARAPLCQAVSGTPRSPSAPPVQHPSTIIPPRRGTHTHNHPSSIISPGAGWMDTHTTTLLHHLPWGRMDGHTHTTTLPPSSPPGWGGQHTTTLLHHLPRGGGPLWRQRAASLQDPHHQHGLQLSSPIAGRSASFTDLINLRRARHD